MMELTGLPAWMLTIVFLLVSNKKTEAVNCYVCSWNPQDKDVEPDRCSTGNFDEHRVRYINCYLGCEVVKILDSNGELLMFYRNCLMASPNKLDFDKGYKKKNIMTEEEMYACDSDLCNSAMGQRKNIILLLLMPILSKILFYEFS